MQMQKALLGLLLVTFMMLGSTAVASAHQPFFEDKDFTATAPWTVKDPTVSTALYATLESANDVDYVVFDGKQGQSILIGLTIPQIEGQDTFTPTFALMGPGLPRAALPKAVTPLKNGGAVILRAAPGPATVFDEPFSGTSYWERQEDRFILPADGRYAVAVWNEAGQTGRYTLVVGDKEIFGGDPAFPFKMRSFWTPVPASEPPAPTVADHHCGH